MKKYIKPAVNVKELLNERVIMAASDPLDIENGTGKLQNTGANGDAMGKVNIWDYLAD